MVDLTSLPDPEGADVDDALAMCERITEIIDDELTSETYYKAEEFFYSAREKAGDIEQKILEIGFCSHAQFAALEKMLAGVEKWIK